MKTKNKNSKTFIVTYTKRVGGEGTIMVKAPNEELALKCAQSSCFTGRDFRNAVETTEDYVKPTAQGFQGSQRAN